MNLEMKNIFVTGGSGFLGGHILYRLTRDGYNPIAIKRKTSNLENIKEIFYQNNQANLFNNIKWLNCDLDNVVVLEKNLQKNDVVFHCAGFVSFNKHDKNKIYDTNYIGTKNLVNLCLKKSISQFCHVSSIATLSNNEHGIGIPFFL